MQLSELLTTEAIESLQEYKSACLQQAKEQRERERRERSEIARGKKLSCADFARLVHAQQAQDARHEHSPYLIKR